MSFLFFFIYIIIWYINNINYVLKKSYQTSFYHGHEVVANIIFDNLGWCFFYYGILSEYQFKLWMWTTGEVVLKEGSFIVILSSLQR